MDEESFVEILKRNAREKEEVKSNIICEKKGNCNIRKRLL
jgi:hypothetical protein